MHARAGVESWSGLARITWKFVPPMEWSNVGETKKRGPLACIKRAGGAQVLAIHVYAYIWKIKIMQIKYYKFNSHHHILSFIIKLIFNKTVLFTTTLAFV